MQKRPIQRWIQILTWPTLILAGALLMWSLKPLSVPELNKGELNLSSLANLRQEIEDTEFRYLQGLSSDELSERLKKNRHNWLINGRNYNVTPDTVEIIEKRTQKKLPKRFANNPIFKFLDMFASPTTVSQYEDVIACDNRRLFYQQQISREPDLTNLLNQRTPQAYDVSENCILQSMSSFDVPRMNYGICQSASGRVLTPGIKPCVTPQLVQLTTNFFSDMTACLQVNPQELIPRIAFESGFFLNTVGPQNQVGVGQLHEKAILELNEQFASYISAIEKSAETNVACQEVLKYRKWLTPAESGLNQRCSIVGLPENPARNIFYTVLWHKANTDRITGVIKNTGVENKLLKLGLTTPDMKLITQSLVLAAYAMGVDKALEIFNLYLKEREKNNLSLTTEDFNFHNQEVLVDIDGQERSAVEVARQYVLSSYLKSTETDEVAQLKLARRKEFPRIWAMAFQRRFPIYLTLKANSYDGKSLAAFEIYGFPGYLNLLADRHQNMRETFKNSGLNPDLCTAKDFLKYDQSN